MKRLLSIVGIIMCTACSAHAATTLFDGSLGTTIVEQGWTLSSYVGSTYAAYPGGYTRYNSSGALSNKVSFSAQSVPAFQGLVFDRTEGFEYNIRAKVNAIGTSYGYTGFIFTIIASDHYGVSFMINTSSMGSYTHSPGLTYLATTSHDFTQITDYRIVIDESNYYVYLDDAETPDITGTLYLFSSSNNFGIGDGTNFGSANVDLYSISTSLGGSPAVPEPASLMLLGTALLGFVRKAGRIKL